VWVAADDFVFEADYDNDRVQELTPRLDFHGFVCMGQLNTPAGVCADDAVIMVSEATSHRVSALSRDDGALLRDFVASGLRAAATVSCAPRMDCASCPGTVTSQSLTVAMAA
jgi:hypothetical protein